METKPNTLTEIQMLQDYLKQCEEEMELIDKQIEETTQNADLLRNSISQQSKMMSGYISEQSMDLLKLLHDHKTSQMNDHQSNQNFGKLVQMMDEMKMQMKKNEENVLNFLNNFNNFNNFNNLNSLNGLNNLNCFNGFNSTISHENKNEKNFENVMIREVYVIDDDNSSVDTYCSHISIRNSSEDEMEKNVNENMECEDDEWIETQ